MSYKHTPKDLRKYQWRAIRFGLQNPCCALFLDMGLGKTVSVLSIIKALKHNGKLDKPILICAPIRPMYGVWAQEAAKWRHTRSLSFSIVHGHQRARMAALNVEADVYLINPEGLRWLLQLLRSKRSVRRWPFGMLVIDESSMFKAAGTKRFRLLRNYVHLFERRIILSGTPTPNSLMELWPQMFIVDQGERLGTSFTRFRDRFFAPADYQGYSYEPREGTEEYIYNLIRDVALSMEYADWLDVPKTIPNPVFVELPPHARRIYDEFERELFLAMDRGDVEAFNAASLSGRCHQIANGAIYTDERLTGSKIWEEVHDAKIKALQEIVAETGSPVLVAYWYKHDAIRLRRVFPNAPFIGKARDDTLEREWNKGMHKVMFAHYASAAHGMNLQYGPGHTIALFSLTWSYEKYHQLISRIGNARAQRTVMVHHIRARNTTDDVMSLRIERKQTGQRSLYNALKERRDNVLRQGNAKDIF